MAFLIGLAVTGLLLLGLPVMFWITEKRSSQLQAKKRRWEDAYSTPYEKKLRDQLGYSINFIPGPMPPKLKYELEDIELLEKNSAEEEAVEKARSILGTDR